MAEKSHPGKRQKMHHRKMKELKMHPLEIDRKIVHWNLIENTTMKYAKMENAHPGN